MKKIRIFFSLIFILLFCFSLPCFASESYPDPLTVLDSNYSHYGYIVCQRDGDTTYLILMQGNSQEAVNGLTVTTAGNIYNGYYYSNVDSVSWSRYTLRDGSWSHDSTRIIAPNEGYSGTLSQQLIISSTYDIINHNDGSIFFNKSISNKPTENSYAVLEPLQTALVASITPVHISMVLASIIGVGMAFVLMWFGVRKLIKIFKKAIINGKIIF